MPRHATRLGRPALLTALLGALSAALLVPVVLAWPPLVAFDARLARTAHGWALGLDAVTRLNRVLSDWVWDPWTMRALATVACVWLWRQGARLPALLLAVSCVVGTLVQQAMKALVDKDRPRWQHPVDSADSAAFPSGHAMTATVVCGLLLWLLRRQGLAGAPWTAALSAALVSVLGVGVTRVWLGVHWPSDVLGGWLFGGLTVALAVGAYRHRAARV
ncbi:phosphatase PAP2 family protein [Streptomyces sp. KLOTTS4A1]|uniref:phosphatase PAP2 family protein n=1 Tax=Streptomyces sp. KLOTTS4A1 TaxID=3390996 RepID=UPI0039F5E7FC